MNIEEYEDLIMDFGHHRDDISFSKRDDYTKGDEDVLANFKGVAKATGLDSLQVWLVYSHKHWDAICNYVKTGGQSESEPIRERLADLANYLELGYALIKEKENIATYKRSETMQEWFYDVDSTNNKTEDNVVKDDNEDQTEWQYKIGDEVEIIDDISSHGLEIGTVVTLDLYAPEYNEWWVETDYKVRRLMIDQEFKPV